MSEEKKPLISLEKITKIYDLGAVKIPAIVGIDLKIYPNEYMAIMGPSGSGKSTLMNIIGCLDTPTSGKYFINGREISSLNGNELAKIRNTTIGFVFQTFNLLPRANSLHNVELPMIYSGKKRSERKKRAIELLQAVGLGDRLYHKPNELSGGERQRVAIARALVNNPSIILADEPTGNLDSKSGQEIMALFNQIHRQGTTIIIVTHEEYIAHQTKRIVRLLDGRIISDEKINP